MTRTRKHVLNSFVLKYKKKKKHLFHYRFSGHVNSHGKEKQSVHAQDFSDRRGIDATRSLFRLEAQNPTVKSATYFQFFRKIRQTMCNSIPLM